MPRDSVTFTKINQGIADLSVKLEEDAQHKYLKKDDYNYGDLKSKT